MPLIINDVKSGLTLDRLKKVLDYDETTGIFRWRIRIGSAIAGQIAGSISGPGYRDIRVDRRHYKAHRLAWFYVYGEWPPDELDHQNLVRPHNAIENLRKSSRTLNNANHLVRSDNQCGIKGIYRLPNGKWRARIRIKNRRIHIGCFETSAQAHAAYVAKARELFGEFANPGS